MTKPKYCPECGKPLKIKKIPANKIYLNMHTIYKTRELDSKYDEATGKENFAELLFCNNGLRLKGGFFKRKYHVKILWYKGKEVFNYYNLTNI